MLPNNLVLYYKEPKKDRGNTLNTQFIEPIYLMQKMNTVNFIFTIYN